MDILFSHSRDGLNWDEPEFIDPRAIRDAGDDWIPDLAIDDSGRCFCVWASRDNPDGSMRQSFEVVFSSSSDSGHSWFPVQYLNPGSLDLPGDEGSLDLGAGAYAARIGTDGAGNCIAVWPSQKAIPGDPLNLAHILMSRSLDAGASWTTPTLIRTYNDGQEGDQEGRYDIQPHIGTDRLGNWLIAWSTQAFSSAGSLDLDIAISRFSRCRRALGLGPAPR